MNAHRRAPKVRRLMKLSRALALTLSALMSTLAASQATWQVETLIPDLVSVRVPSTRIAFALPAGAYPPAEFPAEYPATEPEGGVLQLEVFANVEGVWSLTLEVPPLEAAGGGAWLPAEQVLYRVNDGLWLRAGGVPQVIVSQPGPTNGWQGITLEFRLELTGVELAGAYSLNAVIAATVDETP